MIYRVVLSLILIFSAQAAFAETWTLLHGSTFDAKFRGMWGGAAIFQRADGRRAAIKLLDLNAISRIAVQKLNEKVTANRQKRIDAFKSQIDESEGMTDGVQAQLRAVVPYAPVPGDADLEQTVKHLIEQTESGHVQVWWDQLPGKHQSDLESLRSIFATNGTAEQWDPVLDLANNVATTLEQKKNFIVGSSMMAMVPPPMKEQVPDTVDGLVVFLRAVFDKELLSFQSLSSTELSDLMPQLGEKIGGQFRKLLETNPSLAADMPTIRRGESDDQGFVVDPRTGQEQLWVQTEGRWLPGTMADGWDEWIGKATKGLEGADASTMLPIDQISLFINGFMNAGTQQEFDAEIGKTMMMVGPMLQGMRGGPGGGGGGFPAGPGGPGPGRPPKR